MQLQFVIVIKGTTTLRDPEYSLTLEANDIKKFFQACVSESSEGDLDLELFKRVDSKGTIIGDPIVGDPLIPDHFLKIGIVLFLSL